MLVAMFLTTLLCPLGDLQYYRTQAFIDVGFSLLTNELVSNSVCSTPDHSTTSSRQSWSQVTEEDVILKKIEPYQLLHKLFGISFFMA